MAGLVPAIHVALHPILQEIVTTWSNATARWWQTFSFILSWTTWMAGTSPAMTAPIDSVI
jgi:hypothetical protein